MKLAIITTHPIQYNAPLFKKLAVCEGIHLKVFYTWDQSSGEKFDPSFGRNIKWDIPFLDGYEYLFVKNTSKKPGSHHFGGIKNPTLIKEIECWGANVVLVYGWAFHSHLKAIRYFKGNIPVWFRGDSTLLDYDIQTIKDIRLTNISNDIIQLAKFNFRKLFLTWVYRNINQVFFVGTNNKKYYLEYGLKEPQLTFAPHAIDNERFANTTTTCFEEQADTWRKELGLSNDDYIFLYAGKFEPRKNIIFFVKTFVDLTHSNLELNKFAKLILLGNGPLEKEVRLAAKGNDNIIFLPFQNQSLMPIVYRLGDVFCLPSKSETWGLAINEALACGRPVLVSDKVGCARDIVNSANGKIFKSNNTESLNNAILNLVNRKFNSKEVKQSISNYSFQNITKAIISKCEDI